MLDSSAILNAFRQHFSTSNSQDPILLTDIYHAKMRVVKLLSRSHPDYKVSVQEIAGLLAKIKNDGYKTSADLSAALRNWVQKFSNPTEASRYNTNEIILLLNKQKYYNRHANND